MPRKKENFKEESEQTQKDYNHISISTSFSGADAELIKEFARKNQCSRPTAVRLIIRQLASGLIVTLDPKLKERIEKVISHPKIKEKYAFLGPKNFIEWAIQTGLARLTEELGTLRDPSVQMTLNENEKKVAKTLLMLSQELEFYGSVTAGVIAKKSGLDASVVKKILEDFVNNGWVLTKKEKDETFYFPKE